MNAGLPGDVVALVRVRLDEVHQVLAGNELPRSNCYPFNVALVHHLVQRRVADAQRLSSILQA
jgi:hypothetical protein